MTRFRNEARGAAARIVAQGEVDRLDIAADATGPPAAARRRLWLCSPMYLDVPAFLILRARALEVIAQAMPSAFREVRFVAIDDTAGFDGAVDGLRDLADVRIVRPPFNLGHQRALVYALRRLLPRIRRDDVVVTLDADGEDRPEDLPRLLEPLLSATATDRTVVLALRTSRQESPAFKAMYVVFRVLFRSLTGTVIQTGNYAAYGGRVARRLLAHPHFDLCYSSSFLSLGQNLRLVYVPCARGARYAGQSRMNWVGLVMHGFRMLMPFLDRIATRALVGFGLAAVAVAIFGLGLELLRALTPTIPVWPLYAVTSVLIVLLLCAGNFVILFTVFSQAQGSSLSRLQRVSTSPRKRVPRATPSP